jgi:flagellin
MIVQHNLTAMNSNRQLGITTGLQAKSSEKLSSGYKINRAADDAAGLAISEKMRRQIRGLTQASDNVQDGISYVQVADAALAEIDEMLARMNELCIQAANDTLTPEDRQNIDDEIQQLKVECNRTFHTTSFNNKLIWDEHTSDRKVVGTEQRPIFTWGAGNGYYSTTVTEENKGAWPKDTYFRFEATDSAVKVKWTGYDGVEYESRPISWPSEDELKSGFTIALNSSTMDYTTFPAAKGISPNLKLTLDDDATLSQLVSELNNKTVHTYSQYSISGSVDGDSRSSISGTFNYQAGLVSRASITGGESHISQDVAGANRKNAETLSTMSFAFKFDKNANTVPATPTTFDVNAVYSGSVYTTSSERSSATENVWWYYYKGQKYSTSESFSNSDLETAINNALNGTNANNSLINSSSVGGELHINFNLKTSDAPKYKDDGTPLPENIGSYTLHMNVAENETAADIIARIANIKGVNITQSTSSGMQLYNGSPNYFEANIYAGTMQLNIQAGSESTDDNVIPLIYDVLNNHSLGINDLDTLTRDNALAGVGKVKSAAKIVDEQRSVFGAYQNRMEHTVKNLYNTVENTQYSESMIRDTDMAAEMVKYSNNNILAQAGQSMLAQANQTNQGVLSLLQ